MATQRNCINIDMIKVKMMNIIKPIMWFSQNCTNETAFYAYALYYTSSPFY